MKMMKFVIFAVMLTAVAGLYAVDADVAVAQPAPTAVAPAVVEPKKDIAPATSVVTEETKPAEMKKDETPKTEVPAAVAPATEATQVQPAPVAPAAEAKSAVPAVQAEQKPEPKKEEAPKADAEKKEAAKPAAPAQPEQPTQAAAQNEPSDAELEAFFAQLAQEQSKASTEGKAQK